MSEEKAAPVGLEDVVPTVMGPVALNLEVATKMLATVAWFAHGDRSATECAHYVYLEDIQETLDKVGFTFEHVMYGDGSPEQGGQGIRIVMTPRVAADDLPQTKIDEQA